MNWTQEHRSDLVLLHTKEIRTVKCILPRRTSGCGEKLNHIRTSQSLFFATSTPYRRRSQFYLVEDVKSDLPM
jgi:hypothetical protein